MKERGKYGIEYNPNPIGDDSSGLGWLIVAVVAVALLALVWMAVHRLLSSGGEEAEPAPAETAVEVIPPSGLKSPPAEVGTASETAAEAPPAPPLPPARTAIDKRPQKIRNLLMRLEEAEKKRDVELAIETIEQIRAEPGSPAADLDDALARRLGTLNLRRLFERKSALWVKQVEVKRGASASRLAAENGSTLASFGKLNGGRIDRIRIGEKLYVMDHPRFNLVVHRRSRTADLSLNGKFFRRYDLQGEVKAKGGAYELPERKRAFWANVGLQLKTSDRDELELLLPSGTPVLISEM